MDVKVHIPAKLLLQYKGQKYQSEMHKFLGLLEKKEKPVKCRAFLYRYFLCVFAFTNANADKS